MYRTVKLQMKNIPGLQRFIALVATGALLAAAFIALPFVLLFGALMILTIMVAARLYVSYQVKQYQRRQNRGAPQGDTVNQPDPAAEHHNSILEKDHFKPRPHVGQVYDNGQY
ncbi:hypothetical protein NFHSH190041_34170 [Shewanella sp. NFH-SH190041]|uniref:hypothetical protein n=1 Tax=Shewanella sp. NFH-SH190041 TaxID=2950245 RepID=UPI0021C3A67E|nr:hypothetical protein [Shewanella sp. NFH-SH190041]BDM65965.1 hypothetical protein NFHSH190041_34170 [Shewanella sp. NFH-SH190041]